ncbi:hypothetical protein BDZ97DRAFT_1857394 [Flammula alnicola]|nr:hypothetical protein BDZ97DRAFT_1857394 [Flammula alnicola]
MFAGWFRTCNIIIGLVIPWRTILESLGSYVGVCSVVVWVWVTHTLFRCGSRLFTVLSGCVSTSGFVIWWHHHPPRALPPPCHQALGWPPPRTPPCRQHCVLWLFVGRGGFWYMQCCHLLAIVFVFASFRSVSVMFWIGSEAWHARWHVRWLFLRRAAGVRGLLRSCAAVRWFCGDLCTHGARQQPQGLASGGLCGPGDMHYLVWSSSHFFNWSCLSYRRPSLLWGRGPWWSR